MINKMAVHISIFQILICISFSIKAQTLIIDASELDHTGGTIYDEEIRFEGELFTGIIIAQYENGMPKLWKQIKAGRADGLWLEWYENGNLRYKAEWKNGKGHGLWQYLYENGTLRTEEIYEKDINQGIGLAYYRNGQVKQKYFYLDGKKHGRWLSYSEDGRPLSFQLFENGILIKKENYEEN